MKEEDKKQINNTGQELFSAMRKNYCKKTENGQMRVTRVVRECLSRGVLTQMNEGFQVVHG